LVFLLSLRGSTTSLRVFSVLVLLASMSHSLIFDEHAYAGAEHLNPDFVAGFDAKQGHPDPSDDLNVFSNHGLGDAATIVDLGAGSGQFSLRAAERFGRVTAVDISDAMLTLLRQRAHELGLNNLTCVEAGFLSYVHEGNEADGVYTRHALHHLPDFWKAIALTRIAAMLRPGGILRLRDLIYDFAPSEAEEVFARWFDRAPLDASAGYTAHDYEEHIRTEHGTFRWLFEPILEASGFEIVTCEFEDRLYGEYTCVKR
jgi:ubiquinone/menaquinone biosynthesis C-methylase UbiE